MPKISAKQVMLFGIETTYGTDPVLDGTKAFLASNITLTPFAGSMADRQKAHALYGADTDSYVGAYMTLGFDIGLSGSGAAGTAPPYGSVLRACGMAETITASTKVVYSPRSSGQESGAGYFFVDGILHKMLGSMGTLSTKLNAGALPVLSVALTGLFGAASDTAPPTGVESALANFVREIEVNKANTTGTLGGYAAVFESLQADLGNSVVFRDRPNAAYVAITDRNITGQLSMEAVAIATKNYQADAKSGATEVLQVIHGSTAGNIVQLDAPALQLRQPSYQDVNGIRHLQSQFGLTRSTAGDDEFTITVK